MFLVLPVFYESDNEWEDQPGWSYDKHRKMMMNKCPEQTLQVEIQCYL